MSDIQPHSPSFPLIHSAIENLTIFQQLDFTNGETASVFLQLHIWLSLLLRGAEAGSPWKSIPLQHRLLLGWAWPGLCEKLLGSQSDEASYLIRTCRTPICSTHCRQSDQTPILAPFCSAMLSLFSLRCTKSYKFWILELFSRNIFTGRCSFNSPLREVLMTWNKYWHIYFKCSTCTIFLTEANWAIRYWKWIIKKMIIMPQFLHSVAWLTFIWLFALNLG